MKLSIAPVSVMQFMNLLFIYILQKQLEVRLKTGCNLHFEACWRFSFLDWLLSFFVRPIDICQMVSFLFTFLGNSLFRHVLRESQMFRLIYQISNRTSCRTIQGVTRLIWNNEHNYPWIARQEVLLPSNCVITKCEKLSQRMKKGGQNLRKTCLIKSPWTS